MDEEEEKMMQRVGDDLRSLWDERDVPLSIQARLAKVGFFTMGKFANLEDSRAAVRAAAVAPLPNGLGLDAGGIAGKAKVSSLIDAWESAVQFVAVRREVEAEARATRTIAPLVKNDHLRMRKAFAQTHLPLEDKHVPASGYAEKKFEDITEGSYRAESLKEVTSWGDDIGLTDLDRIGTDPRSGNLTLKKAVKTGELPSSPEQLRDKVKIMMVAFLYAKARFPNRRWLRTVTPSIFEQHVTFVLSDQVMGLDSKNERGEVIASPPWALVIAFEFQLRKRALELISMEKEEDFASAMQAARDDPVLFQRFFTTPLQLRTTGSASRGGEGSNRQNRARSRSRQRQGAKSGGKGGKKNKRSQGSGKGYGKGRKGGKSAPKAYGGYSYHTEPKGKPKTADGRNICYAFNNPNEQCAQKTCSRAHCCWWCEENHAGHSCSSKGTIKVL